MQTIQDKVTWVKGSHTFKAGIYIEKMARNVSVYSVYNAAGTYYFGSDRANPLDTNYPYANAMVGSIFAYGDDNTKLVNHAHYTQIEWYLQDTCKASRRLTFDYGAALLPCGRPEQRGREPRSVQRRVVRSHQGRPTALPGLLRGGHHHHLPGGQQDRDQPQDRRGLPLRPAGHVRHLFVCRRQSAVLGHQVLQHSLLERGAHPGFASRRFRVGRVWRRQDGHARRLRNHHGPQLDGGLYRRAKPRARAR